MDYTRFITIEPGKRSGQPCIRGLRMTVRDVLEYLAGGMSVDDILADFPDLTAEDVRASLVLRGDQSASSAASLLVDRSWRTGRRLCEHRPASRFKVPSPMPALLRSRICNSRKLARAV